MSKLLIGLLAAFAFVIVLLVAVAAIYRTMHPRAASGVATTSSARPPGPASPPAPSANTSPAGSADQGFLYGRVFTRDGGTLEGRLRFGGQEEAFWNDMFNGVKHENRWIEMLPPERRPKAGHEISIFGWTLGNVEHESGGTRQLVARFGEIVRLEARGKLVHVTLKNGTEYDVNRFDASDFDDNVTVWDRTRGEVPLDSMWVNAIEFLPTPALGEVPTRLHGTVHTPQGDFTGSIAWDRSEGVGTDDLDGRTAEGDVSLRFDTIRSIARRPQGALVTLLDGREIKIGDTINNGIAVDDPRYGRVVISWDAFERADFTPGGSGPAYGDFPPGSPLTGSVTARDGRRLTGRLVYDLDESETIESFDSTADGVDYNVPFGLLASIQIPGGEAGANKDVKVVLHSGEMLSLERDGDLTNQNAGMLVFATGGENPVYLPWEEIERIDFDRPPAMYPDIGTTTARSPGSS